MNEHAAVPEGFKRLPEGLGYTDTLQPVYRRASEHSITLGMTVQLKHCNMIGICHGGAMMTLADICGAQSVHHARGKLAGSPTLNLSFDFISAAREGDWLEASCEQVEIKRLFGFASGAIRCTDKLICRFNGTFYTPDHDGYKADVSAIAKLHGQS
jgi:uncharacterized protein (TIGR00369 family)